MGRDHTLTDLLVPEDWQVVRRCQAVLGTEGEEYCIYDEDGHNPSTNGLYFPGSHQPTEKFHLQTS